MKKLIWFVLLISPLAYAGDYSLEEFITVGSLTKKPQSHIGKSVDVVDHSIFREYKPLMMTDVIHNVPGVYVKRVNGISGLTNIRIRGARSIDTKVLYNGISLTDPSDPQGSSNPLIGDLLADMESLEILKGASSSTWGSDAIGGVLNIIPKKGHSDNEITLTGEFGTNNTWTERVEIQTQGLYAGITRIDSDGFDAHDDYGNLSGNFNYLFSHSDKFSLELSGIFNQIGARLNSPPVISDGKLLEDEDDPNDRREQELFHGGMITDVSITDSIAFKNKIGITESDRRFEFLPNEDGSGFYSDGIFRGNDFILQNNLTFTQNDHFATTAGHQYERQWYELDQKDLGESDQADTYSNDFFLEESIDINNLHVILAGRQNTHERSKSRTTFDVSGNYKIERINTYLRSHVGTSFRNPSLFELHGAFLTGFGRFEIGNDKLSPERGKSFDMGFTTQIRNYTSFGANFFNQSIRNKIDFVGFSFTNIDGSDSSNGLEAFLEQTVIEGLTIRTSYTYTNGDDLVDVPESLWDASVRYAKGKWEANFRTRYVSDHKILAFNLDDFRVAKLTEEGRFTIDSTLSFKVKPDVTVYVRAENLLDEDYHEGGFRTPGARVYGGITWTI